MRFFTRSARPVRKNHTVTPSTNLSGGTVPNHVLHLTGRSSSGTGSFSNRRTYRRLRSMCDWPPSGASPNEASDTGLLSPDLAAGIRRVKGAKRLGVRIGNWLTVDQSKTLLGEPPSGSLRGKRDRAILALLIG